jgi:hypothetical protein
MQSDPQSVHITTNIIIKNSDLSGALFQRYKMEFKILLSEVHFSKLSRDYSVALFRTDDWSIWTEIKPLSTFKML